jgi:predicted Zn-dependent protease
MALFRQGKASEAFDCFKEAIRLCPTSAVYHANRAAAALKLGRADIAAEDANHAAERDPGYLRAHLRTGRARLGLGEPQAAEQSFKRALELDANCAAARKGLEEAAQLAAQQARQAEEQEAEARRGARPGLARAPVSEEEAVSQLHSAERMLAANPRLEAARCAHVEALLLCQRYADAQAGCEGLLEGSIDRLYLEAEAAWRQGSLAAAAAKLEGALEAAGSGGSEKCSRLLAYVQELAALDEAAAASLEEGRPQACIDACASLLARLEPAGCVGLACAALRSRAEAQAARRAWDAAVADLDTALALDAGHIACLQLRAEVHRQAGAYTASFLDLQRLKKAAPGHPGLADLLEQAAKLCLSEGQEGRACGDAAAARAGSGAADAALRTLCIPATASSAQARQAYLKLAAKWHPDKWSGGSEQEQREAEERFKEVQQAYELLTAAA